MNESKKKLQLELLMEKLRHKTSHSNLTESAKAFRMTILEKRYGNDMVEKSQYQKCLDLLQTNMKVTSLQSMLERLESISRQSGLKFTSDASGRAFFISSDMFYLEVIVEQGGLVKEVHIQHEGKNEPQTCNEIAVCLNSGNFSRFTTHLQGLCAIYQIGTDKKLKAKAFAALIALEADLYAMSKLQNYMQDLTGMLHKSPLGILQQRIGGQPLALTYFVSPYDLLNVKSQSPSIAHNSIIEDNLGLSCTVGIESSTNNKLPITPLLSVTRNSDGESMPTFSTLNAVNSTLLPATFILRMRQPLILCLSYAQQIQSVTGVEIGSWIKHERLFSALCRSISNDHSNLNDEEMYASKAFCVALPDQHHSYFVTENDDVSMKCASISSIPFSHPSHVPQILSILRRQALVNTLLSSCIRPRSHADSNNTLTFEINSINLNQLSISFEHPLLEEMCCVEIDLGADPTCIQCRLYGTDQENQANNEYATKVLQRCLSIPVFMRAILKKMQTSSLWLVNSNSNQHQATSERRFASQFSGDMDTHSNTSGQFDAPAYANGGGRFDGNHSPRTHNGTLSENGLQLSSEKKQVPLTDEPAVRITSARITSEEASMIHTDAPSFSDSGPTESEASEPDISVVEPLVQKTLYSSVSITPVTSLHSSYPNITLERRPGIEIIAVNKDNSVGVPSSLTITPIPSSSEKDHEKKERKRRREDGERMANSNGGGKPAKMLGLGTTVMGPPGLSKQEVINSKVGLAINPSATSPSKHPSSGGKPSLLALKSAASTLAGSTSPSRWKKSKERDRERNDREKDRERSKDREKRSRTPTPTSCSDHSAVVVPTVQDRKCEITSIGTDGDGLPVISDNSSGHHTEEPVALKEISSTPPLTSDSDASKITGNSASSMTDTSVSPFRSRKSSLSAVIDKLRLQHNPEDFLPDENLTNELGTNVTYDAEEIKKKLIDFKHGLTHRLDLQEQSSFLDGFVEESGFTSHQIDGDDHLDFEQMHYSGDSQVNVFQKGELNDDTRDVSKEFVRPFPPSRMRTYRNDGDIINPNSPSVSVHIVNVPSPLSFQQTRSPLANQSSISQASPCLIDDSLMDETLVGVGK